MHTAQNELQSYPKHPGRSPGHQLFSLTDAFLETASTGSRVPVSAPREVGLSVFEILAAADRAREAYASGDLESLRERLSYLASRTTTCSLTLSNIIESETLEEGQGGKGCDRFDVVALLHEAAQTARLIVGTKPVRIMDASFPHPYFVISDRAKVRRILTELAGNAAKFTERGRVALILNKETDGIRLTVTDTGTGMTDEQMRAFSASWNHRKKNAAGPSIAGRGLNLAMKLVARLNGSISLASKPGEGTIVEVVLPVEPRGHASAASRRTTSDDARTGV